MLSFYRRLRQYLLSEGKIGKYLQYAVGEIILVVIGILIALQINTWNSERLAKKQMDTFLQGILEDLKSDTANFNTRIQFFEGLGENLKSLLVRTDFSDISADSMYLILRPRVADYELNSSTFDKIASTGITQISSNDSLSKGIYNYYTVGATNLKSTMDWDKDGSTETGHFLYYEQSTFELNLAGYDLANLDSIQNFQDEATRKRNLIQLLSEPTGRNHFKLGYARKMSLASRLVRFSDRATALILAIEKELDRSN